MSTYHENHLCSNCGRRYGEHAGHGNPHVPKDTCPTPHLTRDVCDAMDPEQLGELILDEVTRDFERAGAIPFTPRDFAALALAALDQAGCSRTFVKRVRAELAAVIGE